jgi:hypothetical protein
MLCVNDMTKSKEKIFEWSDAWIFASMRGATNDDRSIDFTYLIASSDNLNRSIPSYTEIRNAFQKLYRYGLVDFKEGVIKVPFFIEEMYLKIEKKRGGLFSIVDNSLSVLNSPRTKISIKNENKIDLTFIDDNFVLKHYRKYASLISNT